MPQTEGQQSQAKSPKVAILVANYFEEAEMVEPRRFLDQQGAKTVLIAPKGGQVQALRHVDKAGNYAVDQVLSEAEAADFDALLIPGGAINADALRIEPKAQEFLREFDRAGKPIAVICHGPWLLVSAGIAKGRRLTSYHTIQDDLRNAGAEWQDSEAVVDRNLLTSRQPSDIPRFDEEMKKLFWETGSAARAASR